MVRKSHVVYVAGPLTSGDTLANIRSAIRAGVRLRDAGYVPVIPHLFSFVELIEPRSYEYWMAWDFALLGTCDTILRLPGESSGVEREVLRAGKQGQRVLYGEAGVRLLLFESRIRSCEEEFMDESEESIEATFREWTERAMAGMDVRVRSVHSGALGTLVSSGPKDAGYACIVHWDDEPERDALAQIVYLEEV